MGVKVLADHAIKTRVSLLLRVHPNLITLQNHKMIEKRTHHPAIVHFRGMGNFNQFRHRPILYPKTVRLRVKIVLLVSNFMRRTGGLTRIFENSLAPFWFDLIGYAGNCKRFQPNVCNFCTDCGRNLPVGTNGVPKCIFSAVENFCVIDWWQCYGAGRPSIK